MIRRDFLRLGSLSSLAWGCSSALAFAEESESSASADSSTKGSAPALIMLWLDGGPSQLETFDPHPGVEIGGPTRAIETALPGVRFAEHLPELAKRARDFTVVRSMVTKEGDHERGRYLMKTGFRLNPSVTHPALGAMLSWHGRDDGNDLPNYVAIQSNDRMTRGGYLGESFDPFRIDDPANPVANVRSAVDDDRQRRRLDGVSVIDRAFARDTSAIERRTLQADQTRRAVALMKSKNLTAFDISKEPTNVRDRYGNTPFGRGLLAARRLVEVGVRCVEVTLGGFDLHARNFEGHAFRGPTLDRAFAALLDDLKSSGRLASTVILCTGEFGRTPKINGLAGRDHWNTGFSTVLAGGGFKPGLVVGSTDTLGSKEPKDPVSVDDLYATVLSRLGLDIAQEHEATLGRPIKFSDGKVRPDLLG